MLSLPPSSGVNQAIIFCELWSWQDEEGKLCEIGKDKEGNILWVSFLPTKNQVDDAVEIERELFRGLLKL